MRTLCIKQKIWLLVLFGAVGLALAVNPLIARGNDDLQSPELPAVCANLAVPAGNRSHSRVYAVGVQVYRWNGAAWAFIEPVANLYADAGFKGKVGTHYAGPTWESNSGSTVVARRVDGCTPDPSTIPWLLLERVSTDGAGIFKKVTYIHRVNTSGGLAPTAPGSVVGEERRVPYTAEYYFYRAGS